MFVSTNTCDGKGECIKQCPTKAIRLINGKALSCLTCGLCYKNCPSNAIFINSYGGYVVDRAKCSGCGMCMYNCPIDNIKIEDGIVYGICSRCGVCEEACPSNSRIDSFRLTEEKQLEFIKSLSNALPTYKGVPHKPSETTEVTRSYFTTDYDRCIYCGRCEKYCPTGTIQVTLDRDEGICSDCGLCSDVCPNGAMNKNHIVNKSTCTLCLNCLKACPHNAISIGKFKINVNHINQKPEGSIISCINCGLCASLSENDSLRYEDSKLRYDPTEDIGENIPKAHKIVIDSCPVATLKEDDEMLLVNEITGEEQNTLAGFCVSCGNCVKVCENDARLFKVATWDGSITDECISCGICCEVCPKEAITLHRGTISVDLDKCITSIISNKQSGKFTDIINQLLFEENYHIQFIPYSIDSIDNAINRFSKIKYIDTLYSPSVSKEAFENLHQYHDEDALEIEKLKIRIKVSKTGPKFIENLEKVHNERKKYEKYKIEGETEDGVEQIFDILDKTFFRSTQIEIQGKPEDNINFIKYTFQSEINRLYAQENS